jgi:ketosteroid isomerase-like protein
MGPEDLARLLIERWNAGDVEGVLDLYTEDASMHSGPDWPEQVVYSGHEGIRRNIEEWRSVWESAVVRLDKLEQEGDRVVASGAWQTRGRASGVGGEMPFVILLTLRGGKIARLEWFTDHDSAVAAARDA